MKGKRRAVISKELSHNAGNSGTDWMLTLECGHKVIRRRQAGKGNGNWKYHPVPKFVYCKKCLKES